MRLVVVALGLLMFGTCVAGAPVLQRRPNPEADRLVLKIRQVQIANQLVPVLFTKEQLTRILPVIERARQAEVDLEKRELEEMRKLEKDLDAAIAGATKRMESPSAELSAKLDRTLGAFRLGRQVLVGSSTASVVAAMKEHLNAGQLAAAAGALDPRLWDPNAKPEEMSQDEKLRIFAREVMLDRTAYDLLVEMSLR